MDSTTRIGSAAGFLLLAVQLAGCHSGGAPPPDAQFSCGPLQVVPGTYVYVNVQDRGEPVPGADVTLTSDAGATRHRQTGSEVGSYGCFLEPVEPGDWTLSAQKGPKTGVVDVRVATGELLEVLIRVE